MDNPYAIYVNCDGVMDYTSGNPGGVGFNISFPESVMHAPFRCPLARATTKVVRIKGFQHFLKQNSRLLEIVLFAGFCQFFENRNVLRKVRFQFAFQRKRSICSRLALRIKSAESRKPSRLNPDLVLTQFFILPKTE